MLLHVVMGVRFPAAGSRVAFRARPVRMIRVIVSPRFGRHRNLYTQFASLRGSGRAFSWSVLARDVSRSENAYDSVRSEHEFWFRLQLPMQFRCGYLRGVSVVV